MTDTSADDYLTVSQLWPSPLPSPSFIACSQRFNFDLYISFQLHHLLANFVSGIWRCLCSYEPWIRNHYGHKHSSKWHDLFLSLLRYGRKCMLKFLVKRDELKLPVSLLHIQQIRDKSLPRQSWELVMDAANYDVGETKRSHICGLSLSTLLSLIGMPNSIGNYRSSWNVGSHLRRHPQ